MSTEELIERLLALPDVRAQERFLRANAALLDGQVATALKGQADQYLWSDIHRSQETAQLLFVLAELSGDRLHHAQGLLAQANALCIGLAEYEKSIALYDQAAEIYGSHGRATEQARSQVGKIGALANLGRYEKALEAGRWASGVLEEEGEWQILATLTMNLGIVHSRAGDELRSLASFDRAAELYEEIGADGQSMWLLAQQNRAVALCTLGRFEESIEASRTAMSGMERQGQTVEAARARQCLALTYFVLGRYNEALAHLEQVREIFLADGRQRDAMVVELLTSDCLLQLRRFGDVLKTCQRARTLLASLGMRDWVGHAVVNEAVAYAELGRYEDALASLAEARKAFEAEGNRALAASTDVEIAAVLQRQGRYQESLALAQDCAAVFGAHDLPIEGAQARLVAARAAAALESGDLARALAEQALSAAQEHNVPALEYQGQHILGAVAAGAGDLPAALAAYDRAIERVERLRGRLMVEFRVGFVEDKETLYEDAVAACLELGNPARGLQVAEQAKSRSLLDLVTHRLSLGIQAHSEADRPLVDELLRLRAKRDRLYRRWEGDDESAERGWSSADADRRQAQQEVLGLEQEITDLWHRLLIRNADYAREASLWTIRTEPVQPYLPPDTLLIEYFCLHGELIAFLVSDREVQAHRLGCKLADIQPIVKRLWLNLEAVPRSGEEQVTRLAANARGLLHKLYQLLLAPLASYLGGYQKLVVVPHGLLHYLPFHALHDGTSYLLEQYEVSYLPGASFLRYCQEAPLAHSGLLAVGHSLSGHLPHVVHEAQAVAALLGGQVLLEDQARPEEIGEMMGQVRTVHLAAHGDFRADNPLFSGLSLSDGWLTTLDIFGLRLQASLVTLSACQTGRNVVGGGDELLGLMRAFLCAGAASLVLSLWAVEDRSTAELMVAFYEKLSEGWTKGAALRHAQLQFLQEGDGGGPAVGAHPYYWAPFFLVGAAGPL